MLRMSPCFKTIAALFASGMVTSSLSISLPAVAAAEEQTTLSVSYSNPAYGDFLEKAATEFEKQHPGVDVKYMAPVASHGDHLARVLRSAATGELPDLTFQGYHQISVLVRKGLAVPLDDFIASEKDWSANGLTQASVEACEVYGKAYGLPFESATPTLFFNLDLVKRAGGDPDRLPSNWEGIIELANKIHKLGNNTIGGFYDYNASGNWNFQALINSEGGRMMNADDTEITFDGPEGKKAFEVIKAFGQTGMVDMNQDQAFQAFGGGQIGVITQANTYLKNFEKSANGRFEIRTVRWPLSSEKGQIPIGGRGMMMLTKDQEKQKIAWAYMKFIISPEMQTLLAKMTSTTPVNMIAIKDPAFLGTYYSERPNEQAAIEALSYVTGWYTFPGDNSEEIVKVIRDHLRDVAVKQVDVDSALVEMSEDVKTLLPK